MTLHLRIAVADDEPDMRDFYRRVLPLLGHEVVAVARNGAELVERCLAARPDLVIMDVRMPDMDGIEAAARINHEFPVPVILVSAYYDPESIERAEAQNVLGYLVKPVRADNLQPAIAIARRRAEQMRALEELSQTDALTGLANRRGFAALGGQFLRLARRQGKGVILFAADLDGLKPINDNHGHAVGDGAIRAAADVLRGTFRSSDVLARLGGDEFAALIIQETPDAAEAITRRIEQALEKYNADAGRPFRLALSAGIAWADAGDPAGLDELLARADAMLYERKRARRNNRGET